MQGIVIGIENLRDVFTFVFVGHGVDIVATVKIGQIKFAGRFGRPEAHGVDHAVLKARNRGIVSHGHYRFGVGPVVAQMARIVHKLMDAAIKVNRVEKFGPGKFPGIAVTQPVVWRLNLITPTDMLKENTIFVANAIPIARNACIGHRIQITGRQSPQAAIAQAGVPFGLFNCAQIHLQGFQGLAHFLIQAEIEQGIAQRTANQKFE